MGPYEDISREDAARDMKLVLVEERLSEALRRLKAAEEALVGVQDSITKGKFGIVVLITIGGAISWVLGVWKDVFFRGH